MKTDPEAMNGWIALAGLALGSVYYWHYRRYSARASFKTAPLKPFYRQVLQAYCGYYQALGSENKKRFEVRVQNFIDANEFIPRGYSHLNDEMKALIAGAAIQLTFGFEHLNFAHFNKILLYPDDYYSRITLKYHQGEVNPRGFIVLSWSNFKEGFHHPADGRNLALHELAHALRLENAIRNAEFDFIDKKALKDFDKLARKEIEQIRAGGKSFFRPYAASNQHEFFAVAVENFFERPAGFMQYNPALYQCLARVLKQDPLRLFSKNVN